MVHKGSRGLSGLAIDGASPAIDESGPANSLTYRSK
jgi:hypothetical protein